MKDQTSLEFHRKCTKCGPLKNSTSQKISMKDRTSSRVSSKFVLSVDLWKIPHLENINGRSNFSRISSECTKYRPLKNSTLRKNRRKIKLSKSFNENILCVELWKIPHLENIDESPNSSSFIENVLSVDLWKIPHIRKYRWKTKLLKGFIVNVLSVDLWKIPHLENINERFQTSQEFHRECTKCVPLKNSTLQKMISMKDRTSQEFHRECTKCGSLKNSTLRKYRWKTKLL